MDESFSPVISICGLAFILGEGKACTLPIWRTLANPRPGLRQELREAWNRRVQRVSPEKSSPRSFLRGVAILTIGITLVISHATFAASQMGARPEASMQMAFVESHAGEEGLHDVQNLEMAENCYLKVQKHRTPQGLVVSRIEHECD